MPVLKITLYSTHTCISTAWAVAHDVPPPPSLHPPSPPLRSRREVLQKLRGQCDLCRILTLRVEI